MGRKERAPGRGAVDAAACSDGREPITAAQQDSPDQTPAALLARLSAEYPVLAEYRPLAIGVHLTIHAALPDTSLRLIHRALAMHCGRRRYLAALAAGGSRYVLNGTPTDSVSEQHRAAAQARLAASKLTSVPPRNPPPQPRRRS